MENCTLNCFSPVGLIPIICNQRWTNFSGQRSCHIGTCTATNNSLHKKKSLAHETGDWRTDLPMFEVASDMATVNLPLLSHQNFVLCDMVFNVLCCAKYWSPKWLPSICTPVATGAVHVINLCYMMRVVGMFAAADLLYVFPTYSILEKLKSMLNYM